METLPTYEPKKITFKGNSQILQKYNLTKVVATFVCHEQAPYFSVTGEAYRDGILVMAGTIHDLILELMPEAKKYIPLHLSDQYGIPMYALENGFYYFEIWNGSAKYHDYNDDDPKKYLKVLAEHFRIPLTKAKKLVNEIYDIHTGSIEETYLLRKAHMAKWIETQKERWLNEALKFYEFLEKR